MNYNKILIITGASSGIGEAVARAAAIRGFQVLMIARNKKKLDQVASSIRKTGGKVEVFQGDLANVKSAASVVKAIQKKYPAPDVIVNNAGAGRWLAVDETPAEEVVSMMGAPYFAAFFTTAPFLPAMIARGSGEIVNVTSPASILAIPGAAAYSCARWALRGFTEALQADLRGTGVRAKLFLAGKVESSYFANNPGSEERIPKIDRMIPVLSTEKTAELIMKSLNSSQRMIVVPFMMRFVYWNHLICAPLVRWLVQITGWKRR